MRWYCHVLVKDKDYLDKETIKVVVLRRILLSAQQKGWC